MKTLIAVSIVFGSLVLNFILALLLDPVFFLMQGFWLILAGWWLYTSIKRFKKVRKVREVDDQAL